MLRIKATACINAPVEDTWAVLSDLEKISDWSEPIITSLCSGQVKRGVGAERVCHLKRHVTVTERVIEWQEGESFTYEAFDIPLIKSAKNTWSVSAVKGKTLLTTESEIIIKGGILGSILEPIMSVMFKKMGADTLAAFQYLVENGSPYTGKHALLPKASMAC